MQSSFSSQLSNIMLQEIPPLPNDIEMDSLDESSVSMVRIYTKF